jgi:hypothetical protein
MHTSHDSTASDCTGAQRLSRENCVVGLQQPSVFLHSNLDGFDIVDTLRVVLMCAEGGCCANSKEICVLANLGEFEKEENFDVVKSQRKAPLLCIAEPLRDSPLQNP